MVEIYLNWGKIKNYTFPLNKYLIHIDKNINPLSPLNKRKEPDRQTDKNKHVIKNKIKKLEKEIKLETKTIFSEIPKYLTKFS